MDQRGQLRIGTSGWVYRHWRGAFYPPDLPAKRWFAFYARHFDTVEVNNTFYRLPPPETFDGWRRQAPPGFVYAVKASRYLTHRKKLKDPDEPLANVLGRARRLRAHRGPVLYQLPPRWRCDLDRLRAFVARPPAGFDHVLEFRDPSWCVEPVRQLLAEAGVSFCIHDLPGFDCPAWVTGPVVYLRFHGPTAVKYAGRCGLAHLHVWAERIREFRRSGRDTYAYFNNDDRGYAVINARELQALLGVAPAVRQA